MSQELLIRTKAFCLEVIELTNLLPGTYLGKYIKGQLLRAACSVAANHRAARVAQSNAAFIAKVSIVIEEAEECEFWCELIKEKSLLDNPVLDIVHQEAKEITSIFLATRRTMKTRKKYTLLSPI